MLPKHIWAKMQYKYSGWLKKYSMDVIQFFKIFALQTAKYDTVS